MTTPPPADPVRPSWRSGWRRFVFPGVWLAYLLQTVAGVHKHNSGWVAIVGYTIVLLFAACYLFALAERWATRSRPWAFVMLWVLWLAAIPFAPKDSAVMCIFLAVLSVGWWRRRAWIPIVLLALAATYGPALVPGWHEAAHPEWLVTIPLVGLAMWGFFAIVQTNAALSAARAEVARLAAENERTRIARDLHDLLGQSLTTITVKAGLARRLAERGQPERALREIGEVERLSRRTLADVRAAVSGQRDIRLANELATAREMLRAAGIAADLPPSVDIVDPTLSELFGWVVREGITNVVRHSRATKCTVTLEPGAVEITDDGLGASPNPGPGSGLTGLGERVASAGGTLTAGPAARGFRLRVEVPVVAPAGEPETAAPTIST